jgi:hypothetical protein
MGKIQLGLVFVGLVGMLLLDCGGRETDLGVSAGNTATRDAGSACGDVEELNQWSHRLGAASCARAVRCEPELGPAYSSETACLADVAQTEVYSRYFLSGSYYQGLARKYKLGADDTQAACLRALVDAPCGERVDHIEACNAVLVPCNPIAAAGACRDFGLRPCAQGLACRGETTSSCGSCVATNYPDGHDCEYESDCQSGHCLESGDAGWQCASAALLKGEGEACANFADCRGNLECVYQPTHTCAPRSRVGEPCGNSRSCVRGAECAAMTDGAAGVCRAFLADGEICPRTRDPARACLNWCVFPSADAPEGTCGIAPTGPGPCAAFRADHELFCPADTYMDAPGDAGAYPFDCTCKSRGTRGTSCATHEQCADGPCRSGTCAAPDRAVGDDCDASVECISANCDDARHRCAERPQGDTCGT